MYSDALKNLNLDFTIFYCGIFCTIILIVHCSVNHLERLTGGTVSLAKFFKMIARSSAKSELRVNSADFEVGENHQIISGNGYSFLELRAL